MEEYIEKEYYEMYRLFCSGEITEEFWKKYCFDILNLLMKRNKDILQRLKEL